MKKIFYTILVGVIALSSCGDSTTDKSKNSDNHAEDDKKAPELAVYHFTEGSTIGWGGKHNKDEAWVHQGTIAIKSSEIKADADGIVKELMLEIDMASIKDTNAQDTGSAKGLETHLTGIGTEEGKVEHFFNAAKFPTAKFELVSFDGGNAKGKMTILDKTEEVNFPLEIIQSGAEELEMTGEFDLDLAKFGIPLLQGNPEASEEEKGEMVHPTVHFNINLKATK